MGDLRKSCPRPRRSSKQINGGTRVKDVYFVVLPQLVLLDLAGPAEAFRLANKKMPDSYRLHFIAPTRSVQSAIGLQLGSLEPLPTKLAEDAIVVLTGVSGESVDLSEPSTQHV